MNDNVVLVLWCLLIGAMLITLEMLLVKWINTKTRRRAADLLEAIGFSSGNEHHDYIKVVSGYTVTLNHIPKERLFQKQSLRIGVNFELPWKYDLVDESLKNLKIHYEDYQWSAGLVCYDSYITFFPKTMNDLINFRVDRTVAILNQHGLNPITFEEADKQFLALEEWLRSNAERRS